MIDTVVVLPTPRALLPPVSVIDPVAELRRACHEALDRLLATAPSRITVLAPAVSEANRWRGVTDPLGHRVARQLLAGRAGELPELEEQVALPYAAAALLEGDGAEESGALLVMADGSARRTEQAPGHLDPRAVPFDDVVEQALRDGDAETLAALDPGLAAEVWCEGAPALRVLGELARGRQVTAEVSYADAPYGVAWWVARWDLAAPENRTLRG